MECKDCKHWDIDPINLPLETREEEIEAAECLAPIPIWVDILMRVLPSSSNDFMDGEMEASECPYFEKPQK